MCLYSLLQRHWKKSPVSTEFYQDPVEYLLHKKIDYSQVFSFFIYLFFT